MESILRELERPRQSCHSSSKVHPLQQIPAVTAESRYALVPSLRTSRPDSPGAGLPHGLLSASLGSCIYQSAGSLVGPSGANCKADQL